MSKPSGKAGQLDDYRKLAKDLMCAARRDARSCRVLAQRLGVSVNTVSDWTLGKRPIAAHMLLKALATMQISRTTLACFLVESLMEPIQVLSNKEGDME